MAEMNILVELLMLPEMYVSVYGMHSHNKRNLYGFIG